MSQDYEAKQADYFGHPRVEIEPLLAPSADRVLEIGCGAGATLRWLKSNGRAREVFGIELFHAAGVLAREHADEVVIGDAEGLIDDVFSGRQFDLILCLDVLEHMVDPWSFVARLHRLLAPSGRVIFSLPNVRSLSVVLPLIFLGRWRYRDEGILDRTHLRFFTRESAFALATTSELKVQKWLRSMPSRNSRMGLLRCLTLGLFPDLMARQYLISATRHGQAD